MSIVRNTVILRNAALGALVVLALFECNGFVTVRFVFGIKGVFCKENRSNTLRTSRVHGPRPCTRPVRGRVHGPFTAVCTAVYTAVTRPCTRHIHGRVHGQYTAVYTGHVDGPYTAL